MSGVVQALEAAGVAIDKEHIDNVDKMRCGILVGTAMGGMATFAQAIEDLTQRVSFPYLMQHAMPSVFHANIYCIDMCFIFKCLKPRTNSAA